MLLGLFLLENCPKLKLNGEAAALALSKWLSSPSVLSKNMILQTKSNSILEMWRYFQKNSWIQGSCRIRTDAFDKHCIRSILRKRILETKKNSNKWEEQDRTRTRICSYCFHDIRIKTFLYCFFLSIGFKKDFLLPQACLYLNQNFFEKEPKQRFLNQTPILSHFAYQCLCNQINSFP